MKARYLYSLDHISELRIDPKKRSTSFHFIAFEIIGKQSNNDTYTCSYEENDIVIISVEMEKIEKLEYDIEEFKDLGQKISLYRDMCF